MTSRKTAYVPQNAPIEDEKPKTLNDERREALDGVWQLAQWGCLCFGQFADAGAIGQHGPSLSSEVMVLVDKNAKIAKKLDLLIEIGPYTGIIAAALPFLAQILVNHGVFKAERFANAGVVHPETLEAQMKTQLQMQAMMAMAKQREAEEQMRTMQEEMLKHMNGDSSSDQENWERDE
jgi:hypothetical protein